MSKPTSQVQPTDLGKRIRRLRKVAGLSARALSEKVHVSSSVVSQIESGLIKDPSGSLLTAIASALGTTVEYIVTGRRPAATGTDGH